MVSRMHKALCQNCLELPSSGRLADQLWPLAFPLGISLEGGVGRQIQAHQSCAAGLLVFCTRPTHRCHACSPSLMGFDGGRGGGPVSPDEEERASVLLGHFLGKRSRHCPVSA